MAMSNDFKEKEARVDEAIGKMVKHKHTAIEQLVFFNMEELRCTELLPRPARRTMGQQTTRSCGEPATCVMYDEASRYLEPMCLRCGWFNIKHDTGRRLIAGRRGLR